MSSISPNSPMIDSVSDRASSSPLLSVSTDLFNRLQAFQVYLEMSGSIDTLTDCIGQLDVTRPESLEQFKTILRSKIPQTVEADYLQQEINELRSQIAQLKKQEK